MADDKNKGLTPEEIEFQDQISDETTPESMTRALRRRASMLGTHNTRERQRRLDMEKHQQNISEVDARYGRAISGNPLPTDDISNDSMKRDQDIRRHAQSKLNEMQHEFEPGGYWENYRKERADADLIKSTNTFVGSRSTNDQISRASRSVSSLGAISKTAGSRTSTQLEADVLAEKGRLAEQQEEIRNMAASGLNTPEEKEAYRQAGIHHQESINRLGVLSGAQTRQSRKKTDLFGKQRNMEDLVDRVGKDSRRDRIASDIASSNIGSLEEETLGLDKIKAEIEKVAAAFEKGGKAAEALGDRHLELSEEYDKQKAKVAAAAAGGGVMGNVGKWSGTVADVLQAGSVGLKTIGVDQELRDIANRTGFAAISNQQFQDHQNALGGDMAALRRMETDQYGKSGHKAGFLGALTAASVGMSGGADALAISSQWAQSAGSGTAWLGGTDTIGKNISVTAQRGMSAAAKTTDGFREISSGETRRQAFHAYMALSDEEKRVQDTSMQAYRDTMGGNTLASRGAGSGRSALFRQMNDPASRMALAKLGMSTDQMQNTYAQGIGEMGADFRGASAAAMVKRSAELQKSGMMNAGDYMSSMGQLNAVGGGASGMESIMKNAVANGMDSSRNIQQMVAGIAGLSSASAMMGISTAAGATNAMGLALDTQALRSLPAEMRAGAAANQIGKMNSSMSDSSMNLFNVAESFALRAAAPDVSDAQIARMQKLTATELSEIQADPSAAGKLGLGFLAKNPALMKKVSGIVTRAESNKQGGLILSQKARAAMNARTSGMTQEEFAAKYPEESQEILAAKGLSGINAAISDPFLTELGASSKASSKKLPAGSSELNGAENILAKHFQAMEKINTNGQEHFKKLYGNIKEFNDRLENSLKDFNPKAYEEQAGKGAEGSLQVKGFDGSVSNFSKAVDKFVDGVMTKLGVASGESSMQNMEKKRIPISNPVGSKLSLWGGGLGSNE